MRTGVIRICKYCGKSFKAHRTSSVGKYCSRDCVNKSMKVQDIKKYSAIIRVVENGDLNIGNLIDFLEDL